MIRMCLWRLLGCVNDDNLGGTNEDDQGCVSDDYQGSDNDDDQECVNNDELDVYGSFSEKS